jgi:hypothetical protein
MLLVTLTVINSFGFGNSLAATFEQQRIALLKTKRSVSACGLLVESYGEEREFAAPDA